MVKRILNLPIYPSLTVKEHRDGLIEINTSVRIERDGIWYRVPLKLNYTFTQMDLQFMFQSLCEECHGVIHRYEVSEFLIENELISVDDCQLPEKERLAGLAHSRYAIRKFFGTGDPEKQEK